jgi:hypothetical protein
MTNIKFVVRVDRAGSRVPAYVQQIDRTPMQMTTDRKRAQIMGKLTAEDAVKSIQHSGCRSELVPVRVAVQNELLGPRPREWSIVNSTHVRSR